METSAEAASSGKIDVLRFLKERGCTWDVSVCVAAVRWYNSSVLQYLREQGVPWDERVLAEAARRCVISSFITPIRILRYLHENGCPWDESVSNHLKLLREVVTHMADARR